MKQILLNPGPANTTDAVKNAQIVDDICPRETDFTKVMTDIRKKITNFLSSDTKNFDTVLFASSGTGAVESILTQSHSSQTRWLIIENGAYGKRAQEILDFYKIEHSVLSYTDVIDYSYVIEEIKSGKYSNVFMVHHETTTGVLNKLDQIGCVCKEEGIVFAVDAMSSAFAIDIDMSRDGIDFLATSSNKNVQGMAGVGIVVLNKNIVQKCKSKSFYFNLKEQFNSLNKSGEMRFTPPVQTLYALNAALDELEKETIQKRMGRYSKSFAVLHGGMTSLGFFAPIPVIHTSKILTMFEHTDAHENFKFKEFHEFMYNLGFTIYPGKVNGRDSFRIANMGNINTDHIHKFLVGVKKYLNFCGHMYKKLN